MQHRINVILSEEKVAWHVLTHSFLEVLERCCISVVIPPISGGTVGATNMVYAPPKLSNRLILEDVNISPIKDTISDDISPTGQSQIVSLNSLVKVSPSSPQSGGCSCCCDAKGQHQCCHYAGRTKASIARFCFGYRRSNCHSLSHIYVTSNS